MELFFKVAATAVAAALICLILGSQSKDYSLLLSVFACCLILLAAASFLKPVLSFFRKLQELGSLDSSVLSLLGKTVGITVIGELSSVICTEAGNSSLGKLLQFITGLVILWLSLPVFTRLMELIQKILGEL